MSLVGGSIKVRSAHPDERKQVVDLLKSLHREVQVYGGRVRLGPKTDTWLNYLFDEATSGRGLCFVAADNGGIVGTSIGVEEEFPYDNDLENPVFGFGTYVLPAYRKHGIAELLYKKMTAECRARGNTYIGAYLVLNAPIQRLLKRFSVQEIETMIIFPRE